ICIRVPRGSGWQDIGAYVNLEVYYLVGVLVGVVLAFVVQLKGKGLWIGILTGSTVDAFLLALKTISQIGKNMLLVPKKKKKKKNSTFLYIWFYFYTFLQLNFMFNLII
ncbi:protein detoxification 8, partial [Quercus suber]